jgi:hypothetical protein
LVTVIAAVLAVVVTSARIQPPAVRDNGDRSHCAPKDRDGSHKQNCGRHHSDALDHSDIS